MSGGALKLYTPEVLALATQLAQWPIRVDLPFHGRARSTSCGSSLELALGLDGQGRIDAVGLSAHACAIGQAAAAIFAASVSGQSRPDLAEALAALEAWLDGSSALPSWPGLSAIAAAKDYPARHGALLLPWKAALDALP